MIDAVRSVTKKPLRVNAYQGWKDKEEAVQRINWLESQGLGFVEQPMAAAHLSPLVDYADLDGNLPISTGPYLRVNVERGKLVLPERADLGLVVSLSA
jgi:L-alanine-DL-glutamate epimerase-like enolase superfamily enzyme